MKVRLLAPFSPLLLAACDAPALELPAERMAAARMCSAVMRVYREQAAIEGEPMALDVFGEWSQFALIAAAQQVPFDPSTLLQGLGSAEDMQQVLASNWRPRVDDCLDRFGVTDSANRPLPESEIEAGAACLVIADFLRDALASAPHLAPARDDYAQLSATLETWLDDPGNSQSLSQAEYEASIVRGGIAGFAAGNPVIHAENCQRRFAHLLR
ncbi:hypothetical protein [Alteraurantiacibacter palmitatis]|uniref:Uncharacterized protein n=1 Tax=Alteraurantiacibacter palmitatis TaxID=2054628 RepID=A0ABV7E6L4_9SPHN